MIGGDYVLRYRNRFYMLDVDNLMRELMTEADYTVHTIRPGFTKMYKDLKMCYQYNRMKDNIIDFVSICLTYQRVKAKG